MPSPQPPSAAPSLSALRIIIAAFLFGVLGFAAVTAVIRLTAPARPAGGPTDSMLLGLTALLIVNSVVIGAFFRSQAVAKARRDHEAGPGLDEPAILQKFGTVTILRGALAEGAALLGVMTTFLTGNWLGLVAAGFAMLVLAAAFPTRGKLEAFVRDVTGRLPDL
ncbi:MAG: hypothetical protein K2Q20_15755 [Phycisphaerales bacterium]|nr:hypothetical protein [Phycisphaerales bacterium]